MLTVQSVTQWTSMIYSVDDVSVNRQPVPATYAPYEPLKQAQRVAPAAQRVTPAARAGARGNEP